MMQMISPSPAADEAPALTSQLFRYAQDLDELMQQHKRLQQHHQMLLQSMDQEVHGEDLLARQLARTAQIHWVTDEGGRILRIGELTLRHWSRQPGARIGHDLLELLDPADREAALQQLQHLAKKDSWAGAVHLRLRALISGDTQQGVAETAHDALLMRRHVVGRCEIDWFLHAASSDLDTPLQGLTTFLRGPNSDHGMLLTGPQGRIGAVNGSYCRISGFAEAELIGQNPRMLSSGRHDASFFKDLYVALQERGCWSGTLFNRRKTGQIFLQWQVITTVEDAAGQVLSYLAAMVDLSHAEPSIRRLEAIAYTDPLTGLPNRRMLVDRLGQVLEMAQPGKQSMALLFIDLDHFKPINDQLGHAVGDEVLQEVANRMQSALQPGDLLARVGGDEFVVVLQGQQRAAMAEQVGAQLQDALSPVLRIRTSTLSIGASIGCARYPQDGQDLSSLLQHADAAMYGAKRFGMPFCHYEASLDAGERPNLELDLWQALERQQISLVYQPQISNNSAQPLRGCEALMRWSHPVAGEVDPVQFIALAEKSGAIVSLGNWALNHACKQLADWRLQGLPDFTLSLNISLRQLRHPAFHGSVQRALEANRLPADRLEMEFSETQAMLFVASDTALIQALRTIGVRIAIDDYGISFSNMSRLNFLSISSLKINQQCVQELTTNADARAISNCVIAISRAMGIEVIAQGVETEEQAQLLQQQGCHVLQGFYTGHPLSADLLCALAQGSAN